jgi:probable rRNA maturation factor
MAALSVSAFDEQSDVTVRLQRFEVLAQRVLEDQGVRPPAELSISFVSEPVIAELNLRYRGVEGPTDVLSFAIDGAGALEEAGIEEEEGGAPTLLGDVVVCPAVARANAEARGGSLEAELGLLVVHGVLHVLGFDHEVDEEAEVMEALEHRYLQRWWDPAGRPGSDR